MRSQIIDCSDERTVQMLYEKLGRPALAKTMRLVGRPAAEEILQEVFSKLWENKMRFPDLRRSYSWVYKCCTNAAIDYLRNHNNSHKEISERIEGMSAPLEEKTHAYELWQMLSKSFTEQEIKVFVYRTLEGLNQDEVAEVMGISRRTVNRLQEKIEEKLRKIRRTQDAG